MPLATLAFLIALPGSCTQPFREPETPRLAGGWRSFEGTWSATGDRHAIDVAPGLQASVVDLTGSLLLAGEAGLGVGFQAHAIAFSDGTTANGIGRAVWTDERGDRIFSELRGDGVAAGRKIRGTITGGTGRWSGIAGEYGFEWKYVVDAEGRVQGRTVDLKGRARIAAPRGEVR
jgi:hypothetical protein